MMIQYLTNTNPAGKWLQGKFQTSLRLVNGQLIVLRFDVASCGTQGFKWTADKVIAKFDPTTLVDKETDYGEYLSMASTIADVLNQKMQLVANDVLEQVRMSLDVLGALSLGDRLSAYVLAVRLTNRLLIYSPESDRIWSAWIENVIDYAKPEIPPNAPGINIII